MRIAFMGKGGSGKTTASAAFIKYLSKKHPFVLAIDGDLNVHLGKALGIESLPLAEKEKEVQGYLEPERDIPLIGTTPPTATSRFIRPLSNDPFIARYAGLKGSIGLLSVGTYTPEDIGYSCYHGKLGVLESIYHHLIDRDDEIVVSDATAGIDSLGTSLFFTSDINVFVIEPTLKGISVFKDFVSISQGLGIQAYALVNKAEGPDDLEFVYKHVGKGRVVGSLSQSKLLKRFEQGDEGALDEFSASQAEAFEAVLSAARRHPRNWERYQALLTKAYLDNCTHWYNDFYGQRLERGVDPDFSYARQ